MRIWLDTLMRLWAEVTELAWLFTDPATALALACNSLRASVTAEAYSRSVMMLWESSASAILSCWLNFCCAEYIGSSWARRAAACCASICSALALSLTAAAAARSAVACAVAASARWRDAEVAVISAATCWAVASVLATIASSAFIMAALTVLPVSLAAAPALSSPFSKSAIALMPSAASPAIMSEVLRVISPFP
ncbi:MAG: hypothetical protein KGJ57_18165 [Sphingomonadales bacterium]|nr:hypothetical protein [Sphingomonadales bacterium]MDE2171324.1 hypothetical protein [Sphingomonadales bacterium]